MLEFEATGCAEQVWAVLTTPASTRRFLFGITLESTWASGSPITAWLGGRDVMHGEVLFAAYPSRLPYVLASGLGQPEAYVTWDVRNGDRGAIVQLFVDEPDADDTDEVQAAWLPVVTTLRAMLSPGRD